MAPVSPGAVSVDSPNQGSKLVEYEDAKPVDSKHMDREEWQCLMYCTVSYKGLKHLAIWASTGTSWNQPSEDTEG